MRWSLGGVPTSWILVWAVRLRKDLRAILELGVHGHDVQEVMGRTVEDVIAEPTSGLLVGLRYREDGTTTVARRAPWHPLSKACPIACLLVKLSWHLGGLSIPLVLDQDLLE